MEIHAAHGYLLNQFYSPLTNHREDAYAGSTLEGRTRLHVEVIEAVRAAVGKDYPIAIRFGACDYEKGGSEASDVAASSAIFERAGADLIDVTGGLNDFMIPGHTEPGWFANLSRRAWGAVRVPVLVTGGVKTPQDAERLLEQEACDLVGVGRALLQDPRWPEHVPLWARP